MVTAQAIQIWHEHKEIGFLWRDDNAIDTVTLFSKSCQGVLRVGGIDKTFLSQAKGSFVLPNKMNQN